MNRRWLTLLVGVPFLCILISLNVHLIAYAMISLDFSKVNFSKTLEKSKERIQEVMSDSSKDLAEKVEALVKSLGLATDEEKNQVTMDGNSKEESKLNNNLAQEMEEKTTEGGGGGGSSSLLSTSPLSNGAFSEEATKVEQKPQEASSFEAAKSLGSSALKAGKAVGSEIARVAGELVDQVDEIEATNDTPRDPHLSKDPEPVKKFNKFLDPEITEISLVDTPPEKKDKDEKPKEKATKDDVVVDAKKEEKKATATELCDPKQAYGGIGLQFERVPESKNPQYVIKVVAPNQPADKAGIQVGDIIEGDPLRFKGPVGSDVDVEVIRAGKKKLFAQVKRSSICYSVISPEIQKMLEDLERERLRRGQ